MKAHAHDAGILTVPQHSTRSISQTPSRIRVLFLCTGNDCRSQMAEAFLRKHGRSLFVAASAGSVPTEIHPLTIATMQDADVRIFGQWAKSSVLFADQPFDHIVNLCARAKELRLTHPGRFKLDYWNIEDPAAGRDAGELTRARFTRVRDEIDRRVKALILQALNRDLSYAC